MSETVDIHEAAALMKVHYKTVLELIETKELPAARIGRPFVMMRRDVLALIEKRIMLAMTKGQGQPRPKRQRRAAATTT